MYAPEHAGLYHKQHLRQKTKHAIDPDTYEQGWAALYAFVRNRVNWGNANGQTFTTGLP